MANLIDRAFEVYSEGGAARLCSRAWGYARRRYFRAHVRRDRMGAIVEPIEVPRVFFTDRSYTLRLRVRNESRVVWNDETGSAQPFAIAMFLVRGRGEVIEGIHHPLPRGLGPGEACEMDIPATPPLDSGEYRLRFDLVREGCFWFSEIGVEPLELPLTVAHFDSVITVRDPPEQIIAGCMYKARVGVLNSGKETWNPAGSTEPTYRVAALFSRDGRVISGAPYRLLPADVAPGQVGEVDVVYDAPRQPGGYRVRVDVLREGDMWYSERGGRPFEHEIEVVGHSTELFSRRLPAMELTIDLTNKCPLKCIQCRKTYVETPDDQFDMDFALFQKIASETAPYVHSVMLSSAGEPLMSPRFLDAVETLAGYRTHEISFTTSGLHLNAYRAEKMVDLGVGRVEFSIDGASAAVYERIRVGSSFEKVMRNIETLTAFKAKKGSRLPLLRFNFVMMKSNIHQLPELVDLAARLGVAEVLCQHMVVFAERVRAEALIYDRERSNHFVTVAKERARQHGIRFFHPPLFEAVGFVAAVDTADVCATRTTGSEAPSTPEIPDGKIWIAEDALIHERKTHPRMKDGLPVCTDPWRKFNVDRQGLVFPCCLWKEEPVGDLRLKSFAEIWDSEPYRRLRDGLVTGNFGRSCAECSVITGGDINAEQSFIF